MTIRPNGREYEDDRYPITEHDQVYKVKLAHDCCTPLMKSEP